MAYNGVGVWIVNSTGQPVVAGTTISSSVFNALTADLATGLSTAICKDGQQTTTAIIPFALGLKTDILSPYTVNGPVSLTAGQLTFPATQNPSANANTLDDYEEGTYTPADGSGAGLTFTVNRAAYVKIGSIYFCDITLGYPVTVSGANAVITNLPGTFANVVGVDGSFFLYTAIGTTLGIPIPNTASFNILNSTGASQTNAALSGTTIRAQFTIHTI